MNINWRRDFIQNFSLVAWGLSVLPSFLTRLLWELSQSSHLLDTLNEDPQIFEAKLCQSFFESGMYSSFPVSERASEHIPEHLNITFSPRLQPGHTAYRKLRNDIFQQQIFAEYDAHKDVITQSLTSLGIPAHKLLRVYTLLQVIFSEYMTRTQGNTQLYFLTAANFQQFPVTGEDQKTGPAYFQKYLEARHSQNHPNASSKFLAPAAEVEHRRFPVVQQYTIQASANEKITHPKKRDREIASDKLTEAWYTFSSSRLGSAETWDTYAQDRTCLHGMSSAVYSYMVSLLGKLREMHGYLTDTPVVSWLSEPGHGWNRFFSHQAGKVWYLADHPENPAVLDIATRNKIWKTHGSGNKVDLSSRGIIWFLLSQYFWLRKENSTCTKKEIIDGKAYIVEARYHLGHFDICVLPQKLYELG